MTTEQAKKLLVEDPNFVAIKRYGYSLTKMLERYPDGCPHRLIAQALLITEDDVQAMYDGIVLKLRARMKVEV